MCDPRPDLINDSRMWSKLLRLAQDIDPNLFGVLHGFRCQGTRIRKRKTRYVLRPEIDPTGKSAWISRSEYEETRDKWLGSYQKEIVALLKNIKINQIPEEDKIDVDVEHL